MTLSSYDAWKLATPPEYECPDQCPECDQPLDDVGCCQFCGWDGDDGPGDAYDTLEEAELAR